MNIIQVVPSMAEKSSGVTYCVHRLSESLAKEGAHVELHTLAPLPDLADRHYSLFGYPISRFPHPRFGRSPKMRAHLLEAGARADIIHSNGLWMAPNIYSYLAAQKNGKKLVVMPHGMFQKWCLKRSRFKKELCWHMGQRTAMRQADMLIATSSEEYRTLREFDFNQPIALLPIGIDIPQKNYAKSDRRMMLFLSRIHPKKGLQMLIPAWKKLQDEFPDWDIKIAGPSNAYAIEMQTLAKTLQCKRIEFCGEVVGEEKVRLTAQSECLILPTFSENFGMVVAEALAAGTAAICTKQAPWDGLTSHHCGISCDCNLPAVQSAMRVIMSNSKEKNMELGKKGKAWMQSDFSWDSIGKKYFSAYQWLLGKADKPECVLTE